jgi:hypothetical protein
MVTVKTVADTGHITLADGRILPPDYRSFCHGYAVTSHASQAKTVDQVLLLASSRSFGAVNREQFYVSISRGRQRCRIFTDDSQLLRERIVRSASRKAALELAGLAGIEKALAKHGFTRQTAREQVSAAPVPGATTPDRHRAVRPLRQTRLSSRNRVAQAFTAWAAYLKQAAAIASTRPVRPIRPLLRRAQQRPCGSHQQPSNHI